MVVEKIFYGHKSCIANFIDVAFVVVIDFHNTILMIKFVHQQSKLFILRVSILMKRSLICFKEFNEIYHKRSNYISFFKNRDQIETKKIGGPT